MIDVILNEQRIIDNALKDGIIEKNPMITLKALLKHYYKEGITDKDLLKSQLIFFMQQHYDGFKISKWEDSIDGITSKFIKDIRKYNIDINPINVECIEITQPELDIISYLNDKKLEKIAFVMLVYAKIANIIMKKEEGWINKSCSSICKEAKVNLVGNDKARIFNKLYKNGYISQRDKSNKTNIKVNYIVNDGNVVIKINQFEGVVHYYLNWKGENWRLCTVCKKKWFKQKSKKPIKYCSACAEQVDREKSLERWKNNKTSI